MLVSSTPRGVASMAAAAAVLISVLAGLAAPADADTASFADGSSTPGTLDIHRVVVINEERLTVRVVVDDLQRRAGQGEVSVWLDTDPGRSGPEFFIGSGLWDSDWQISRARDWRVVGNGPLPCAIDQRLLFDQDKVVFTTGKACLGRYGKVRVSATTRGGGEVDHSPARHTFHPWVRRF